MGLGLRTKLHDRRQGVICRWEIPDGAWQALVQDYDVVSFDIFDTLIRRRVSAPTEIFRLVEQEQSAPGFHEARIMAERRARERHADSEDVTLEQIYRELPERYRGLRAAELTTEEQCVYAAPEIFPIYETLRRAGKRLVICSDMYLPAAFLEGLLVRCGYRGYEACFVSSEVMKTKGSGSLFRLMAKRLGVSPARILHVGDDPAADGTAFRLGMGFVQVGKNRRELLLGDESKAIRVAGSTGEADITALTGHAGTEASARVGALTEMTEGMLLRRRLDLIKSGRADIRKEIAEPGYPMGNDSAAEGMAGSRRGNLVHRVRSGADTALLVAGIPVARLIRRGRIKKYQILGVTVRTRANTEYWERIELAGSLARLERMKEETMERAGEGS